MVKHWPILILLAVLTLVSFDHWLAIRKLKQDNQVLEAQCCKLADHIGELYRRNGETNGHVERLANASAAYTGRMTREHNRLVDSVTSLMRARRVITE